MANLLELTLSVPDSLFLHSPWVINPEELKISSSVTDGAFLHSLLSMAALRQDLLRGLEVSKAALYHRGETIRLLREQLTRQPPDISEETIGAVASLSIFDVSDSCLWFAPSLTSIDS